MKRNLLLLLLAVFLVSCEDDELELPFLGEFTVPDLPYAVHDEIRMTNVGEADTYHWDFGDGTTSTLREPSHAYKKPGAYSIKLVTKHKGQESRVYREVKVGRYYAYEVELLQYADNYWLEGGAASGPSVGDPNVFLQVLDMNQEENNVLFNRDTLHQVNHGMLPLKWELKKKLPLGI
ncbi:MAG: PKD domain-containing protein, partial [Hymenobacteraceae bacterium]|nr:PKD domain-containing protein [Hymenobacteraceae bacterium]